VDEITTAIGDCREAAKAEDLDVLKAKVQVGGSVGRSHGVCGLGTCRHMQVCPAPRAGGTERAACRSS